MNEKPSEGDVLDISYESADNGEQKIEDVEVEEVVDCEEEFVDMYYEELVTNYKIVCSNPKSSWHFVILVADGGTFVLETNTDTAEDNNLGGNVKWEVV